ncbi:hypothetical protein GMORB2_1847 [Geosmithia morbida]|uniref:ARCA-like protein n=1 Tax=Geosmithia morbida TaxID=1094350 RepID=A0A9P4YRJ3_9HYPO|nr:uncharacterized protein GMORB2_1847 [Geosmithia morbida]KAF4121440.1 hypothetical protein GMORB2_1847 [Geosmithia morbida]
MPMPVPNNNHMPLLPALHGSQESVTLAPIWPENANHGFPRDNWSVSHQASAPAPQHMSQSPHGSELRTFPLQDVQEACLLKYYVEEIGHWLDLADEDRHFQLVVPVRARSQPHLLNSIFAVAARHLCRMPQYRTAQGIEYMGQLLPHLDKHSAVEYTLKCIPALRNFHEAHDDEYRDSIIATAVILRQLEEIDDEDDGSQHPDRLSTLGPHSTSEQINFLPIIDSVLRSPPSQTLFGRRSLIRAAYWMALRQEIYHSFTRRQAPQLILASDYWPTASNANKAVMHTVQVVRWLWGDGTEQEWKRLVKQQDHVEQDVLESFRPIFRKQPDRTRGEIFPTVWYASNIEVTSNQQAMMAKSVLLAENPALKGQSASRSSVRQAESDVRALILELCGAALCPPASPPAILNAAFVIQMYGDFFTDPYERQALGVIVAKYRATNAWPSQKLTEMFG